MTAQAPKLLSSINSSMPHDEGLREISSPHHSRVERLIEKKNKIITCFPYYKWQQIKARCTNSVALRLADFAGDAHWGRSDVLNWLLGRVGPYRVTEAM